ncbi:EamA-like transporter family protein [Frigoribacterium sp. PhB107]|uniref:EamA family transporter n=1 Tax=Frigoribacterium sp. PhB107 TaxID=2485172 RepID=UPI000F471324|nr:EamA family transporter [Frigoribacterium sp. PhB107]ROP75223.1 EamA-like transporter family protein [Frigoribacterium sp. PhB107]
MSGTALLLVLAAAVCHASWNVVAHGVSRIGTPFLWWGAVASAVLWLPVVPFTGGLGGSVGGLALGAGVSAVLHVVYMVVLQRGYAAGSLSTVYATARGTGPAVSAVLAVLLLGERLSALAAIGIAVVVAGVVATGLVDRRPRQAPAPVDGAAAIADGAAAPASTGGASEEPAPRADAAPRRRRRLDPGIAWGLLTGLAIASYTIWDAHALRTWELSPVSFMVGVTAVEVLFYTATLGRRRRELLDVVRAHWPRVLAFGVLSPMSYILVLVAIQTTPVALVAPARETSVVMVAVFGALVLREGSVAKRLTASVVVLGGIALLAL